MKFNLRSLSRKHQVFRILLFLAAFSSIQLGLALHPGDSQVAEDGYVSHLDRILIRVLRNAGFTGNVEATLEARLGRRIDPELADLGRLLFFDKIFGLHNDNSCAGCHSPAFGFGDSQPMAIGVDNNDIVGPNRRGPRNQRRSPLVSNTIFLPGPDVDSAVRGSFR